MLQTRDRQGFSAMTFTVRISPMSLVWFPVPTYLLPLAWTSQTSFEYISNIFKQHIPLVRSKLQEYKHHIEQKTEKRCLLWSHNSHDVIQLRSYAQEFFKVPLIQPDKKTQPMRGPACHSCFQASPKTTIHSMHATSKFKKYENYSASNWATFELVSPFSDDRGIFFFHNNLWRSVVLKVANFVAPYSRWNAIILWITSSNPPPDPTAPPVFSLRGIEESLRKPPEKARISMFLNNPPAPFSISPISSWHLLALDGHINLITNCKDHWSCTSIYQVWSPICSSRCKSQDHPHGHITDHLLAKFTTFSLLRDGSQNSLDLLPNGQIHSTFTSWDAMIVVSDPANWFGEN